MSSYIGKVQIGPSDQEQILIGSTLYGTCSTPATTADKVVTLPDFDTLMKGITVHVRFINGNSITSNVRLAVGSTTSYPVVGNCVCNENDIIPFTYYEDSTEHTWYANTNIVVAEGTTDGTIKVNGQDATVHGLGTAAYTPATDYATAAQGTLADNAMPISGGTFTGAVSGPAVSDASPSGTLATIDYVQSKTAGLSGLTGAMHFKGTTTTAVTDGGTQNPTIGGTEITTKEPGDVVLYGDKEFVWTETDPNTHIGYWELLGDEGSYVLATSQTTGNIGSASGWNAGSASSATVVGGVLQITNSIAPSLTVTSTNVVVPVATP